MWGERERDWKKDVEGGDGGRETERSFEIERGLERGGMERGGGVRETGRKTETGGMFILFFVN